MSQHDYNIANGGGAAVRSDINSALGAIQSLNSGVTAPTTTVAGMLWYDTATGSLKQRNSGNTAWVSAGEFISGGQLAGLRNRIINGAQSVSQRNGATATVVGSTASTAYNVDRWQTYRAGGVTGATSTGQQITGLTAGPQYFTKVQRDSGNTSTAVISYATSLETVNIIDLQGKQITLSFWLATVGAATTNGVVAQINQGTGTDGNQFTGFTGSTSVVSQSFSSASWTRYSITGTVSATATQIGVTFNWTPTGTAGATDFFGVTGIQLELGGVATPFEHRPYGMELALCQRYAYSVPIGAIYARYGATAATQYYSAIHSFPVTMRAAPTVATAPSFSYTNAAAAILQNSSVNTIAYAANSSAAGDSYFNNSSAALLTAEL